MRSLSLVISFFLALSLIGCNGDQSDKSSRVRVEDNYLTDEEINAHVSNDSLNRNAYIKNWINSELYYMEALDNNVQDDPELKRILDKATRELVNAFWIKKYLAQNKIVPTDSELRAFFLEKKELFTFSEDSRLINMITLKDYSKAWEFRNSAVDGDWSAALTIIKRDSSLLLKELSSSIICQHDLAKGALMRMILGMNPGEISPVFAEGDNLFTVVKLIKFYGAGSSPEFEEVKNDVERIYREWRSKELLEEYSNSLYSKYDIEIK